MAIAYDATSQITASGWSTGTSMTWSHTCTGSDRYLIVGVSCGETGSDIVSGVTYNGVAMTRLLFATFAGGGRSNYLYGLVTPATGANNIVVSHSNLIYIHGNAVSYTGVKQSAQPDSTANGSASATSLSVSTTTVADNSWVVGIFSNTSANTSGHTGITPRSDNSSIGVDIGDSNAPKTPAGLYTMTESAGASGSWGAVLASLSPSITNITTAADNGSFILTGQDSTATVGYTSTTDNGSFTLTGQDTFATVTGGWTNTTKSSTANMTNTSKSATSYSNTSKSSTSWTNQTKS